jgi:hypothetical protein
MSIFKNTFKEEIQNQLTARQNAIKKRDVTSIKYLNSRNAWIRMSSSVNIVTSNNDDDKGTSDLAQSYILQGGILKPNGELRSGVGGIDNAYSNISPGNQIYQRGIRPMPGITTIDIKSKSAYGSLREVVVNFQCWDIKQLEDLELLYMRPGYTVLVEWGWAPYLKNDGSLEYIVEPYDIIKKPKSKETIWKEIFQKSLDNSGNYDATFGFVKNYSWSARPDGGYDCSTTIISIGEILESLKVNYTPLNIVSGVKGVIFQTVSEEVTKRYKKNILAGLFAELYEKVSGFNDGNDNGNIFSLKGFDFFIRTVDLKNPTDTEDDALVGTNSDKKQIYITLGGLVYLFNKHITLQENQKELVTLSVQGREYDDEGNNNLLCLAHPLQLSVDPTICYIKNPVWTNLSIPSSINTNDGEDVIKASNNDNYNETLDILNKLARENKEDELIKEVQKLIKEDGENVLTEINKQSIDKFNKTLYDVLYVGFGTTLGISDSQIEEALGNNKTFINIIKSNPVEEQREEFKKIKQETESSLRLASEGNGYLGNKDAKDFFLKGDPYLELGTIANIYVNLQFLYSLSLNTNLSSQDKTEKQEISAYDFLKNVMSGISDSIGNVNNFDIHIDPVDSVARIIDINYVDEMSRQEANKNAFTLQMHNLESTVRSYKLESQIFQEQSTIVAIGSQVQGGALGTDSNTLTNFNRGVRDRIIPKKQDPSINPNNSNTINEQILNLQENLKTIYTFLGDTKGFFFTSAAFDLNSASKYRGALRDLISYFKSFTKSNSKNRSIIPTKLSIEMDGIGGLIIGHLFKIPENLLPEGYKGGKLGSKLGYIITGIGHSITNKDWKTSIDAQTIILDDPTGIDIKYSDVIKESVNAAVSGNTLQTINTLNSINNVITGGSISGVFKPLNTLTPSTQELIKKENNDLILVREGSNISRSSGTLWYKGNVIGYTVEDPVRNDKIKGQTAIPKGTYNIVLDTTNNIGLAKRDSVSFPNSIGKFKFPGVLPRVGTDKGAISLKGPGTLNFAGIRIHSGKDESWSEGCIIYSSKRNKDGTLILDTNHTKVLTKLIFDNKINKIVIINDF